MSWRDHVTNVKGRNPLFDRRIQASPPFSGRITRGKITTIEETPRKMFFFLFNPSVISTSYNISGLDETLEDLSGFGGDIADGLMGLNFELLLDRTYEAWSNRQSTGILQDIRALEIVCGISERGREQEIDTNAGVLDISLDGIMVKKHLRFHFGGPRSFTFDGMLNSVQVTFTNFSRRMVPIRGAVSINASSIGTVKSANSLTGPDARAASMQPSSGPTATSAMVPGGVGGGFTQ